MPPIYVVAFDPSLTCTGYAALDEAGRLLEAGRIRPPRRGSSIDRIRFLLADLRALLDELRPRAIVLEVTSGKTTRRHLGRGAGLGTYGMVVGACWREAEAWAADAGREGEEVRVAPIYENEWTEGSGGKSGRRAAALALCPHYDPAADPGADVSDAITLGAWWLARDRAPGNDAPTARSGCNTTAPATGRTGRSRTGTSGGAKG